MVPALAALVSAILVAGAPALAQGGRPGQPLRCPAVTEADITRQFDRFNAAWASLDPDRVTALFAPNATLLATVSNVERTSPEKIREYFVQFLKGEPVARIDSSTIDIDCTTATRSGNWTVVTRNANGERVDVPARYTFVYKWDGKDWKIKHLHSSVRPAPVQQ
ncbi:SgcJ/EcaC family oxidoreductase [Thermaurantiacus sp.]